MCQHHIIVDRIENGIAVCVIDCAIKEIPLSKINGIVHEGDVLCATEYDASYSVNSLETENRRNNIAERFNAIKTRRKHD